MYPKHKIGKKRLFFTSFGIFALVVSGLIVLNRSSFNLTKALLNENNYSITLDSFSGGDYNTYKTKDGNSLEFIFHNCYKTDEGFIQTESNSSLGNNSLIHGISSITVNSDEEDPIFVNITIFNKGLKQYSDDCLLNNKFTVDCNNDGFSVTFDRELIIKKVVIEYSCLN